MKPLGTKQLTGAFYHPGPGRDATQISPFLKPGPLGGQKHLKCWGDDYPYLGNSLDRRWLPVPENSDAQRIIRKLRRGP